MGLYNVVSPCFVAGRHYVRPTAQPIQVDDTEAGKLVEAGCLTPYGNSAPEPEPVPEQSVGTVEPEPTDEPKRSRRRDGRSED